MSSSSLPASSTTNTSVSVTGSSSFVSSSSVSDSPSLSTTLSTDTSTSASATSDSTSSSPTSSSSSSSSSSTSSPTSSSTDPTSSTILSLTSGSSSILTSATLTSNTVSSSSSSATSSTSILTAPVTVVVQTTVVTTSDGQAFTTVFSTESTAPAGSTVIVGSDSADTSQSTSHTGAIVGGVVGGVVGLLLLILGALWFIRRRRRFQDEAFDGNFDPDRIVRPASGAGNLGGRGPTLPSIPITNSDEHIGPGSPPQMAEVEDDGMGGRLNGSAIGAGVVAPYPLHHPTTSPAHSATSPPPSARSWGNSSDAQHSMYNGHMSDWRGPSPGPSIPTQYTGGSGSGAPPSSYPPGMMGHLPPGASPGPAGAGIPASAYVGATGSHGRRYSAGTSASSGDRQLLYAAGGPGSASSSTGGGSMQSSSRFAVANPDEGAYAGGFNEGKSTNGPPEPRPREVLVHADGGRLETNNDVTPESEGPEEIPPTYDSLLGAAGMASGSRPEKHSQFADESRT
ncbi:hypothetical protein DFJ43DRAFT_1150267 [Lentinula guzmanii]|uniref:REJ domain-containing protein n=1 Tax=Lentinula guzmanii TaxID=2804957 RepID=A0AA38N573_9AGAR|nr:hypothetical protein DFJ43DRAFT_1150267 [Lentinula guzmanii]